MALQLLELTESKKITDNEGKDFCREWKKQALLGRAKQMTSANARHYLIASAKKLG